MAKPLEQTRERELAEALAADLQRRERRTARALLLTERRGLARMRGAVRRANDAVVATAATTEDERETIQHVRRAAGSLQGDLHAATARSVGDARATARAGLEQELERELPATEVAAEDDAHAAAAGQTLAGAWSAAALAAILARGESPLAAALAAVPEGVDGRVRRTAATTVARGFNDERDALLQGLEDVLRTEAGDPAGPDAAASHPRPGLFKVFSAVLDRVTCPRCFSADGEIVEAHKAFKAGAPPLHPYCRCIVEHTIINKTERIEDIGIDYDLFKQELRDVIREGRAISDRRSLAFVSDSLGEKRSAEVLARRFRDEAYATRTVPAGGSGRGPASPGGAPPPGRLGGGRGGGAGGGGGGGSGGAGGGGRQPLRFVPHLTTEIVGELGATASGDIAATTKDLFAGRCPDAESWRRLWAPPPGYALHLETFRASAGELTVSGTLRTAQGHEVADVVRTFKRTSAAELIASHDYLALGAAHQGKRIGEEMTRNALLGYCDIGVARVDVDAHWVGRYAWARFGFSWRASEGEHYRKKLERFLAGKLGDPARARELSQHALTGAHAVTDIVVNGRKLGKEFLLDSRLVPYWSGELRLVDGDVGYEYAKRRLNL